jgi:hypothetical protein
MNAGDHLKAAKELAASMQLLDPPEANIRLYVEAGPGRAIHLLCSGADRRFGTHQDNHQGMPQMVA